MNLQRRQFAGLELCRFLCSATVVISHYRFLAPGLADSHVLVPSVGRDIFQGLVRVAYANGDFAVQVFWVISGFIFFWKYSEKIRAHLIGPTEFFVLRFSRLYPLHFVTLIIVAVLQGVYMSSYGESFIYAPNNIVNFFLQLLFASNWFTTNETFNGPIWSVSSEIVAYFAFFIALKIFKPTMKLCFIIILITFWFHQPVITCIHFFFAGGLIQQVIRQLSLAHHKFAFWAAVAVATEVVFLTYEGVPLNAASVLFLAAALVMAFGLLEVVTGAGLHRLSSVGSITYSTYLIAFPFQLTILLVVDALGFQRSIFYSPAALLFTLFTTIG